jgi:hypothetical protein
LIEYTEKKLTEAINEVAATDAGKILLAAIKESCKWDLTLVAHDNPQVTQFYAAQRGLYGSLRQKIRIEYLKEIEFNYKGKTDDRSDNGITTSRNKRSSKPSDRADG